MHDFAQWWILLTGGGAIYFAARTDDLQKWGFALGLASEPGWFYAAWESQQWGVFLTALWWAWWWGKGAWQRFNPNRR